MSFWSVVGIGALLGGLLFVLARNAMPDDAYITFGYARNLVERGEWALTPGIASNTATSPLNVWLLAGLTMIVGSPVVAGAVLLTGTCALAAAWLHGIARVLGVHAVFLPVMGVLILVASPLLNSAVGLETYLTATLLIGVVRYALFGPWWVAGVVTGLLVLARPDMATAAVAVMVVAAVLRRTVLRPFAALVLGAGIALPWSVFTWLRFGSATSDTLPAKSVAGGWGDWEMANGLGHYLERWTLATSLALIPAAVGAVALVTVLILTATRRKLGPASSVALAFGFAGLADYAALSVMGVVPFFWYYAPLISGLSLCAVVSAAAFLRTTEHRAVAVGAAGMVVLAAGLCVSYDVLRGAPWDGMAPLRINWATPAEYREIGRDLPVGSVVESPGEIGTIAYFCECTVVDYLADPGRMVPYIDSYRAEHPDSLFHRVNYWWYEEAEPVPAQYRIVYEFAPPGPGDWPTHFPFDVTKRMRLVPIDG